MAASNDLEKFREEWKKELHHHDTQDKPSDTKDCHINLESDELVVHHYNDDDTSQEVAETDDNAVKPSATHSTSDHIEYYPFKILTKFLNEAPKRPKIVKKKIDIKDTSGSSAKRKYFLKESPSPREKKIQEAGTDNFKTQDGSLQRGNMLDIFIADLDEINEIPFFDSTVPREVAMKIFQHLDMKSLCRCSQVSHSWRNLADDELLWCRVCQRLGYDTDLHVSEGQGWKVKVQRHVEEKRLLEANWKARIGKPYNLHFARGGVLCAVHSFGSNIVAGYTNCSIRSWDAKSGDICTFNASDTALVLDDSADDLGRIQNEIRHVTTTGFVTAASFRHGFVDIWRKEGQTGPVHTCTFHNPDITSLSACDVDSTCSLVAASQGTRVQISGVGESEGRCLHDLDMSSAVTQLDWLSTCPSSDKPRLFITCHSSVHLKTIDAVNSWMPARLDENITEVHNVIWAPVTSIAARACTQELAVGFNFYAGPSTQIKVNIYDLANNHLKATLTGHTWIISCISMPNSLANQLVTGSGDRKIRLYDLRMGSSAETTLVGHVAKITSVEMDDWKVVSGDEGGFVNVWDRRMGRKLWDIHNRHPVQYCHFDDRLLIVGNVPYLKFPEADEFEAVSSLRYRGTIQVYDFLANQQTQGIPDVCLSSYNEPEAYDYNIGLTVPYDVVS